MLTKTLFALAATIAAAAAAGQPPRPHPADPKAGAKTPAWESAFKDYRPFAEPELARWREVNDEVRRLGGHAGHVPGAAFPHELAPRTARPAGHSGHGEPK